MLQQFFNQKKLANTVLFFDYFLRNVYCVYLFRATLYRVFEELSKVSTIIGSAACKLAQNNGRERISHKQSARWQHISQLKASAFISLQKIKLFRKATTYTWDW